MQAPQWWTRRLTIVVTALLISVVLLSYHDAIPIQKYHNYITGEDIPEVRPNNDIPQTGYFKTQPEWNWEVPDYAGNFKGYSRTPRNQDVIFLTASDGGGHNSAIPNVLERALENREEYCARHGYINLWLNTSRYDIGDAHKVWSKIPALAEAFYLYPNAEWVFLADTDIIVMNPEKSLVSEILSPSAIQQGILRDVPILNGTLKKNPTNLRTPTDYRIEDIDILITQDHQSINMGSAFFRRSAFTRMVLEMMTDKKYLMGEGHIGYEQDALRHLIFEHPLVRQHVGIYPQRKFNSYVEGGPEMGYRDGDLLVHFAGCWVRHVCKDWWESFWLRRGKQEVWKPEEKIH